MDTKKRILETADKLFRERGYKAVTMDALAAQVGISKKTLYQHFENKTDLVEAVRQATHTKHHTSFNTIAQAAPNAIEAFLGFTNRLHDISRNSNPTAYYELERFFPQVYEIFRKELLQESIQLLKDNFKRGIEEGLYRPEIDINMLAYYRVETALMSMRDSTLMYDAGFSLEQISREMASHFLYGLLTPVGLAVYQKLMAAQAS